MIEAALGDGRAAILGRRQDRPAMLDPGPLGHSAEQASSALVADPCLRPVDEGAMDVVARNGGADGVYVGVRRHMAPGWLARCLYVRLLDEQQQRARFQPPLAGGD